MIHLDYSNKSYTTSRSKDSNERHGAYWTMNKNLALFSSVVARFSNWIRLSVRSRGFLRIAKQPEFGDFRLWPEWPLQGQSWDSAAFFSIKSYADDLHGKHRVGIYTSIIHRSGTSRSIRSTHAQKALNGTDTLRRVPAFSFAHIQFRFSFFPSQSELGPKKSLGYQPPSLCMPEDSTAVVRVFDFREERLRRKVT